MWKRENKKGGGEKKKKEGCKRQLTKGFRRFEKSLRFKKGLQLHQAAGKSTLGKPLTGGA